MNLMRLIRLLLLAVIVCLIAYSYHPDNFDITGVLINSSYSKYAAILIGVLFMLSLNSVKEVLSLKPIRIYIALLILIAICFTSLYALSLTTTICEVRALVISLFSMLLGASFRLNNKEIILISIIFSIAVLSIGYLQISQNMGNFSIEDGYINTAKNAFGPLVAIAGTLSVLITFTPSINIFVRTISVLISILALVEIATIRARLATITFLLLSAFIIYKNFKRLSKVKAHTGIYYIVGAIIVAIAFIGLHEYVWDSLTRNKEGDFTSGRLGVYYDGIDIFSQNPLWGNLVVNEKIAWVHNYLLLILSEYGIIISLPLLILFFYLLSIIVKGIRRADVSIPQNYGLIIILISFIISLGEPTYPYGPGTTNFLPFLLFGVSIGYNHKTR